MAEEFDFEAALKAVQSGCWFAFKTDPLDLGICI